MTDTAANTIKEFQAYIRRMVDYKEAVAVLSWDLHTGAPVKGKAQRSEVIGMLSTELFKMGIAPEMKAFLDTLSEGEAYERLDPITRASVRERTKEYERNKSIPPELYREYAIHTSKAETAWEEARRADNFEEFRPYLEKIIDYTNQFIDIWGYEGHRYNTLLDQYEPDITVDVLDPLFTDLRKKSVSLLEKIEGRGKKTDASFLEKIFPAGEQKKFSETVLRKIGYDFSAGRLDESAHPFSTGLNRGDVRVTTRFHEGDFRMAIFSSIHEAGHAMYEQNIAEELVGTLLFDGASMGIHESQSRFWENMIGRSHAFWEYFYKDAVEFFPQQFDGVSVTNFYRAINQVKPSLIRVDADELTYNLHIMIRYELEKALISGSLTVAELPAAWNEKMKEYLGVAPDSNAHGVLQDVHWPSGAFGYFPSYSLGNIYAAQFEAVLRQEQPGYEEAVSKGEFAGIKGWLTEKIHRHGKMLTPAEIIRAVTGESINADYLVSYLEKKYTDVYGL